MNLNLLFCVILKESFPNGKDDQESRWGTVGFFAEFILRRFIDEGLRMTYTKRFKDLEIG